MAFFPNFSLLQKFHLRPDLEEKELMSGRTRPNQKENSMVAVLRRNSYIYMIIYWFVVCP